MKNNSPYTLSPKQLFRAVGTKLTGALKVSAAYATAFFKEVVASVNIQGTDSLILAKAKSIQGGLSTEELSRATLASRGIKPKGFGL